MQTKLSSVATSSFLAVATPRRGALLAHSCLVVALASAISLVSCKSAAAATTDTASPATSTPSAEAPLGLSGNVGLGLLSTPTYGGSARRRTVVAPMLSLDWRTADWGTFALDTQGLAWQFIDHDGWRASLLGAIDPGRKDRRPSALDIAPGDRRLVGMGRVRASAELGGAIGYGPVQLSVLQAMGDRGSRGRRAMLNGELPWAVTPALTVSVGGGATFSDRKYMQAYFGVTPQQSAASGFAAYTPRAGLEKIDLDVGADYALLPQVHLKAGVGVSRLMREAADSPIVQRRTGLTGQVGLAYAF